MTNSPIVHLIQPTIDDNLDPFGNSEVPLSNEKRLVEYCGSNDSNNRNKNDNKHWERKREKEHCYTQD